MNDTVKSSPFTAFQWDDALRLDTQLSEDERAVRELNVERVARRSSLSGIHTLTK